MYIQTLVVGDLSTNCYLITDTDSTDTIIIDPGDDANFISDTLIDHKLSPTAIILTHGHFDHVLGCLELKLNFDIPIYLHQKDLHLYTLANRSAKHWTKTKSLKVPPIDQFIKEGDQINIGNESLTVLETPGHTPGSVCLYDAKKILFSGDTLFADGVGRADYSYSDPLQLTKSLKRISKLPPQTIIYSGHGSAAYLTDTPLISFLSSPSL